MIIKATLLSWRNNMHTYVNQQPSQTNPVKVVWKVQRLILEDGSQ